MEILQKLKLLLNKKQKLQMFGMVILMVAGAILETCSIALVIPVLQSVMSPETFQKDGVIKKAYDLLGMQSQKSFTIFLMVSLIIVFIIKNLFLLMQTKIQFNFVYTNQFKTSQQMMITYMKRPYEYFLYADTAVIQRSITSDVNNMFALILALLQLISELMIFLFLFAALLFIDPLMTIVVGTLLIITILLVKQILKPVMEQAGKDNQDFYSGLFKLISQTVTGIKEIKIANREKQFIDDYIRCGNGYVNAVRRYSLYSATPRLLIETVCIAGMIGYMIIQILTGREVADMVPLLGAFAMAAMRLMPSANRINNQITSISFLKPFLLGVSENMQEDLSNGLNITPDIVSAKEKLPLQDKISITGVTYAYPNTDTLIFDNADMEIPVGQSVGIVGTSGSGKSTIVDILLGLLKLQQGKVTCDGADALSKDNYQKWLKNIGYIPQSIFMLDDTIKNNVAFGIPPSEISEARIWEVLGEARLDDFVRGLPNGMDTGIGERGIRLSGGQRQRIGIARALYDDPLVLVLDEATSALDNDTEQAIMESINLLHGKKTLVIIAHRLQTIEKCDRIYRVTDKKLIRER